MRSQIPTQGLLIVGSGGNLPLPWRRFFEGVDTHYPRAGSVDFSASTSQSVNLSPELPNADYAVSVDAGVGQEFWIENKTRTGFDIVTGSAHTGTVSWLLVRY